MILFLLEDKEKVPYQPEELATVNYNNYLQDNLIDYKGNMFACLEKELFASKLVLTDNMGDTKQVDGIYAPFQLYKDCVVFLKGNQLRLKELTEGNTLKIASGVQHFLVYKDLVLYLSEMNQLYAYDLLQEEQRLLYEDVIQYCMHQEKLFVVDKNDMLVELSLSDNSKKEICSLEIQAYPFTIMSQGQYLVIDYAPNSLGFLDIESSEIKSFSLTDSQYANHKITFICDDSYVFFSFQATKTNGSIVTDIVDDNNGVWKINPQTLEKEKIVSETFDTLYLFEEKLLFGTKNNMIYKIDIEDKQITRIK